MARIGISITKAVPFRDSTQEFSNVYYYENLAGLPDVTQANSLIDEVTAVEKTFHGTIVTFVRGRLWSQEGSPGANNMISQKNLSGTGALTSDSAYDKERAFLFSLRAGVNSRGNPVYLRKWFHACCGFTTQSVSAEIHANNSGFTQVQRDAQAAKMDTLRAIGGGTEEWHICAKSGRNPTVGEVFKGHKYLEHHQLGDQWRAQ